MSTEQTSGMTLNSTGRLYGTHRTPAMAPEVLLGAVETSRLSGITRRSTVVVRSVAHLGKRSHSPCAVSARTSLAGSAAEQACVCSRDKRRHEIVGVDGSAGAMNARPVSASVGHCVSDVVIATYRVRCELS
jgi:hypothetical protein